MLRQSIIPKLKSGLKLVIPVNSKKYLLMLESFIKKALPNIKMLCLSPNNKKWSSEYSKRLNNCYKSDFQMISYTLIITK